MLPTPVTLTVSGMPTGATTVITPSSWIQLADITWSFPANTPLTNISLSIQLPSTTSSLNRKDLPSRKLPLVLWGASSALREQDAPHQKAVQPHVVCASAADRRHNRNERPQRLRL
jgi:hypothetical protein